MTGDTPRPPVKPGMKRIMVNGDCVGEIPDRGDHRQNAEAARIFLESIGRGLPEITREQAMLRQAQSFLRAANEIHARDMRGQQRNELGFVPCVVNQSFAIELYLKTLAFVRDREELKGHKLFDELWLNLSDDARGLVEAECRLLNERHNLERPFDLPTALKQMNSAFVDWRYAFEENSIAGFPLQDASMVGAALDAVCVRLITSRDSR